MKRSILLASLAVTSASLYGMQNSFNNEMNIRVVNHSQLPLLLSDDSMKEDTAINTKESSSSAIQWDIFETQTNNNEKIKEILSDSCDADYLPLVDEIFEEILNPKEKTEQSETFDDIIQLPIEQPKASNSTDQSSYKVNATIGDKRKFSENNEKEKESINKKRIKTSNEENNSNSIVSDKENSSQKNIRNSKKRYFAKKTGLKTRDFIKKNKSEQINEELKKKIEELESQTETLRTSKIKLQTRLCQLRARNDRAEDRLEELQNLVLEKDVEIEIERSNIKNGIAQQAELEEKRKELSKQIDFLKQQINTLQTNEEKSKKQKEQLNIKITEQNEKITNLNRLLQKKKTEIQSIQQINKNRIEESFVSQQGNLQRFGQWLREKGSEILQEKDKKIADLTEQLNVEKKKESRLMFSWNQTLSGLKKIQQREQEIRKREGFWNNLLGNKDKQISDLSTQLQRFQAERNNVMIQQRQTQVNIENLIAQLQKSQMEIINLANQLQETRKEDQRRLQTKNQELAELKAKLEIKPVKQETVDTRQSQQTEQRLKETKKKLEDLEKEIQEVQGRYEIELNKKEGYKSEVNRLNHVLANEQKKSEQQKKESEQANSILNKILLGERWWQNVLKPLNASQKKNEDLREYLLRLMKHSSTRSLMNKFSRDEYSEELVRQLTNNVDIKEHFKILDTNQYYWLTSKIGEEREVFSKSNGYDEDLLNKLEDRNDRTQKQLNKMDKDNEFLIRIIIELRKDKDIRHYIHDALELYQSQLTAKIDRYLTQYKSI